MQINSWWIRAIDVDDVIGLSHLKVQLHPRVWGHGREAPVEALENDELHAEDLLLGAGTVCNVGKLLKLWRVDLFNLGCYKEAGDACKKIAIVT